MKGINSKIKTVWGISEVGFSITATLETAFFIFFLTDVAQLPLAISGIIAGGASAVDIISAAIAGVFINKFTLRMANTVHGCSTPRFVPWCSLSSASRKSVVT